MLPTVGIVVKHLNEVVRQNMNLCKENGNVCGYEVSPRNQKVQDVRSRKEWEVGTVHDNMTL